MVAFNCHFTAPTFLAYDLNPTARSTDWVLITIQEAIGSNPRETIAILGDFAQCLHNNTDLKHVTLAVSSTN
jgi:hypothetical protein